MVNKRRSAVRKMCRSKIQDGDGHNCILYIVFLENFLFFFSLISYNFLKQHSEWKAREEFHGTKKPIFNCIMIDTFTLTMSTQEPF